MTFSSQIVEIGKHDLRALADILGSKSFLLGARPHRVDVTVFAFLAQMVYTPFRSPLFEFLVTLRPLMAYVERVRDAVFPGEQWEESIRRNKQYVPLTAAAGAVADGSSSRGATRK